MCEREGGLRGAWGQQPVHRRQLLPKLPLHVPLADGRQCVCALGLAAQAHAVCVHPRPRKFWYCLLCSCWPSTDCGSSFRRAGHAAPVLCTAHSCSQGPFPCCIKQHRPCLFRPSSINVRHARLAPSAPASPCASPPDTAECSSGALRLYFPLHAHQQQPLEPQLVWLHPAAHCRPARCS